MSNKSEKDTFVMVGGLRIFLNFLGESHSHCIQGKVDIRNVAQCQDDGNQEWSKTLSVGRKLELGMIIASSLALAGPSYQ